MTDEEKVLSRLSGGSQETISGSRITGLYINGSKYDKGLYGVLDDGRKIVVAPSIVREMMKDYVFSCTVPGKDKRRVYVSIDEIDTTETWNRQHKIEEMGN